jgi:hypothetical protein
MEKKHIKRVLFIVTMFMLTACCKHKLMNHVHFQQIPEGANFHLVTKEYGPPYDMTLLRHGIKEYRYIQRNSLAPGVMEHVHFIITVGSDGCIIGKTTDTITGTIELNVQ